MDSGDEACPTRCRNRGARVGSGEHVSPWYHGHPYGRTRCHCKRRRMAASASIHTVISWSLIFGLRGQCGGGSGTRTRNQADRSIARMRLDHFDGEREASTASAHRGQRRNPADLVLATAARGLVRRVPDRPHAVAIRSRATKGHEIRPIGQVKQWTPVSEGGSDGLQLSRGLRIRTAMPSTQ